MGESGEREVEVEMPCIIDYMITVTVKPDG